jgi:hypothetical protein
MPNKRETLTIRLDDGVKAALTAIAAKNRLTVSEWLRRHIRDSVTEDRYVAQLRQAFRDHPGQPITVNVGSIHRSPVEDLAPVDDLAALRNRPKAS